MTTRYTTMPANPAHTAPRAGYYDGGLGLIHMPDSVTVIEQEHTPTYTGLLNAEGEALYKVEERVRLGFKLD